MAQPVRTCLVCRNRSARDSLVRIVRLTDGRVDWDPASKLGGRGAYVCASSACVRKLHPKRLSRALRTEISTNALSELLDRCPLEHVEGAI